MQVAPSYEPTVQVFEFYETSTSTGYTNIASTKRNFTSCKVSDLPTSIQAEATAYVHNIPNNIVRIGQHFTVLT